MPKLQPGQFDSATSIAAGTVPATALAFKPVSDVLKPSHGWVRFAGNTAATGQKVTTGTRTYQCVNTAGLPGTGSVVYDMQGTGGHGAGPWNDTDMATHMAAMINGDASRVVDAVVGVDGTSVVLCGLGTTALALASDFTGSVVSDATLNVGAGAASQALPNGKRLIAAKDVTKLALTVNDEIDLGVVDGSVGTSAPEHVSLMVLDANGVAKPVHTLQTRIVQVNSLNYAVLLRDPKAVLAATDTVYWMASLTL